MTKKMRVAMVINDVMIGGAEAVLLGIIAHLSKDVEPTLYYLYDFPPERKSMREMFTVTPQLVNARGRFGFAKAVMKLQREFKTQKPDVIHCHLPDSVIVGGVAAILSGIPFIMHEHQTHQLHSWKIRLAFALLRPFASVSLCYGESIEREIAPNSSVLSSPPEKLERSTYTILNGIDMGRVDSTRNTLNRAEKRETLGISESDILVLSVGRLVEWKGHRLLTEAFSDAVKKVPALRLRIAGDGEQFAELETLIQRSGIMDTAKLLGSRTDVYELLAAADIFPTVFTYPGGAGPGAGAVVIATYEAMGFGLPVINGDFVPARTIFTDGKNALLVPPERSVLADALVRLGENEDLRKRLGAEAREFAQRHLDWKTIVPIYERVYSLVSRS